MKAQPVCLKPKVSYTTVFDTPYVLVNSRLTSRQSSFSPGSTSGILFTRCMLRPYRTIPCIHCRIDLSHLYGERILRMPFISFKKFFRHLGFLMQCSLWFAKDDFLLKCLLYSEQGILIAEKAHGVRHTIVKRLVTYVRNVSPTPFLTCFTYVHLRHRARYIHDHVILSFDIVIV